MPAISGFCQPTLGPRMRSPEKVVRVWLKVWARADRRMARRGLELAREVEGPVSFWSSVPVKESRRMSSSAEAVAAEAWGAPTTAAPRRGDCGCAETLQDGSAGGGHWSPWAPGGGLWLRGDDSRRDCPASTDQHQACTLVRHDWSLKDGGVLQDALPTATSLQEGSGHRPSGAEFHTRIDEAGH